MSLLSNLDGNLDVKVSEKLFCRINQNMGNVSQKQT